ncbi:MAG: hypothetical protein JO351_07275 [Candidatus Eremiobacteraeota bacterium]|nr:hypothetical protein [Candidatus Eremiobacteraeota bacterium]MBV9056426.1 hypothetical protein [Candidatus Eremiobacteraeota bacterium]
MRLFAAADLASFFEEKRRAAYPSGRGPSLWFLFVAIGAPPEIVRLPRAHLAPLFGAGIAGLVARWILRFQPPSLVFTNHAGFAGMSKF